MGERIVMLGGGAVGGYVGGHLALHGHDVTLIDFWHDNIEAIRKNGLELSGMTEEERQVSHPKTLHMHEVAILAKQAPVDIAFMCMKSYDTEWATQLIKPYLAPGGYVVSLQNCINEERIAGIVGWGRTLGCIASRISVELFEPGKVRRQAPKGAASHTVFRVATVRITGLPRLAPTLRAVSTSFERWTWCRLPLYRPSARIEGRNRRPCRGRASRAAPAPPVAGPPRRCAPGWPGSGRRTRRTRTAACRSSRRTRPVRRR